MPACRNSKKKGVGQTQDAHLHAIMHIHASKLTFVRLKVGQHVAEALPCNSDGGTALETSRARVSARCCLRPEQSKAYLAQRDLALLQDKWEPADASW